MPHLPEATVPKLNKNQRGELSGDGRWLTIYENRRVEGQGTVELPVAVYVRVEPLPRREAGARGAVRSRGQG